MILTEFERNKNLSIQQQLQAIRQNKLAPLYLVNGQEQYLIDEVKNAFFSNLNIQEDDLNFATFDADDVDLQAVLEEVQASPFFGDYRLVFLEHPYFLTSEKKAIDEEVIKQFIHYFEQPCTTTIFVLFADYPKLDERKKVTKILKKNATIIDVQTLKENDVKQYFQHYIQNEQIQFSKGVLDYYLKQCDYQLTRVMQEFQKIKLFHGNEESVTKELVDQLIPKTLEQNLFELSQFVLYRQTSLALKLFDDLTLQKEEPIKLIAILIGQFRLMIQVKYLVKQGYQQANIADMLKIHSYRVKLAMQEVKKYQMGYLIQLFDDLVELDFQIKSGKVDKFFAFQMYLLKY